MKKDNWEKIDRIVEYLSDCEWHNLEEIQKECSLSEKFLKNIDSLSSIFLSLEELDILKVDGGTGQNTRIRGTIKLKRLSDLPKE